MQSIENIELFSFSSDMYRVVTDNGYSSTFNKDNIWIAECWLYEQGITEFI